MDINPYAASAEPASAEKPIAVPARRFRRTHLYVFLAIWLGFTFWTFAIVNSGVDSSPGRTRTVCVTTAATILGPMTGAISRNLQGCCLNCSLSLLPYCVASAGLGIAAQFIKFPFERFSNPIRMVLWIVGWLGWFFGGIVSFMHALS